MAQETTPSSDDRLIVRLEVGRGRAVSRAVAWLAPAMLLLVATELIYARLHFRPTAVSNRLVDYGVAVLTLPLPLAALACLWKGLRWLLFGLWPGSLAVVASEDGLLLRLGSFGTRRYDARRLDVRYPFELAASDDEGTFASFLSEEEQRARLLPRILHPDATEALDAVILRFCGVTEEEAVAALAPVLDRWRSTMPRRFVTGGGEKGCTPQR